MSVTDYLKIGDLARELGVSTDTLRFYESHELLSPAKRSASGYRLYSSEERNRLRFILSAKSVGFTLHEIRELLTLEVNKDQVTCEAVKTKVDEKIAQLDNRLQEMQHVRQGLQQLSDACCGGDESATYCSILTLLNKPEARETSL